MNLFLVLLLIIFAILCIIGIITSVIEIVFDINIKCPVCGLSFNSYRSFLDHYKKEHPKQK
jgi:TM2 domain-containing membrane protein YozV